MNDAKKEAIRKAAIALNVQQVRMDMLRAAATPNDPEARLTLTIAYHTAQAELNEAQDEVNRVTDASFQPKE